MDGAALGGNGIPCIFPGMGRLAGRANPLAGPARGEFGLAHQTLTLLGRVDLVGFGTRILTTLGHRRFSLRIEI